ncbi:MAG TPA: hypothetical protein VFF13_04960 [archaeon]|nr:hypothetical protein [archaeon]
MQKHAKKTKKAKQGGEYISKPDVPYSDARGGLDYYIMREPINWVGALYTKKGSIRANHYHPKQEQKLLLVSGKCVSVYKNLKDKNAKVKQHLVVPGDLVITPPNIAHAVIYLEDSIQINLVHGERKPTNYGKHTVPYELVKPDEKEKYMKMYK